MKTWIATFIFILCFVAATQAQAPSLRITANSEEVTDGMVTMNNEKRILWTVADGMPRDAGYAYAFGKVYLVDHNGVKTELKAAAVANGPVHYITVRKGVMAQHPQGFTLELESVVRHNPDHSTTVMSFDEALRRIRFVPSQN